MPEKAAGGTTSYAWFVWDKDKPTRTRKNQLHQTSSKMQLKEM